MKRYLVLEDGSFYEGEAIGASDYRIGELIFNTSVTGTQEILTDPACCGQIVLMTYPLVGNTGINRDDNEGLKPYVFGIVVKDCCEFPSNFRSEETLNEYLIRNRIPGIKGVDTRAITRKIRTAGTMKAVFCDEESQVAAFAETLRGTAEISGLVDSVSTRNVYPIPGRGRKVIVVDFGVKLSILRELSESGCDITVVPARTSAEEILSYYPDGVILSSGPGNPEDLPEAVESIRALISRTVVFGIGLGMEMLALACGAKTYKMKYGQHGEAPVVDLRTGRVEITSQNHGYAVDIESLKETRLEMTHKALNEDCCEGIRHLDYPCFGVQYNPEANGGPHDAAGLFGRFMELMEKEDANNA